MEKNKRITNILLVVIVILVVAGCVLAYFYFTKDRTKPIRHSMPAVFKLRRAPSNSAKGTSP